MDYQALHNDPAELEQWRQIVASTRSKASATTAQASTPGAAPAAPAAPAGEVTAPEPPLVRQPTASDFSEAAVLGRRGQAARLGWRHFLAGLTGGRLRLPPGIGELRRNQLMNRVRTPFEGTRRIVVMSRKGGVGKTTVTVGVGSTFAALRGDRVVAVDANPDAGNLAHRIAGDCQRTITDLLADSGRIHSFAHMRGYTSQCAESRLEVLASDDDARIAQALDRDAYRQVVALLDHFYNLILLDTGTGILDSANQGLIHEADQLVLVVRPALDGAKVGAQTLDWLEEHGHEDLVKSAVVVVNGIERETDPIVTFTRKHFESRCRHVSMVPWDRTLEGGGRTTLSALQRKTRQAFVDVAAAIADGFSEEPLAHESRETATHGFRFGPLVPEYGLTPSGYSLAVPAPTAPPAARPPVVQPPRTPPPAQPAASPPVVPPPTPPQTQPTATPPQAQPATTPPQAQPATTPPQAQPALGDQAPPPPQPPPAQQ